MGLMGGREMMGRGGEKTDPRDTNDFLLTNIRKAPVRNENEERLDPVDSASRERVQNNNAFLLHTIPTRFTPLKTHTAIPSYRAQV